MIYIFRCRNCGETQERELKMAAPKPTGCRCGGELIRVYTPTNVIYRGSGFYSVDKRLQPTHPLDYDPAVD